MSSPIVDPEIPFNGEIPGGLQSGKLLRIQGVTHPDADRFNINLQTGPTAKPRDDTALHLSVRLNQGYVARNSYKNGGWEDEQGNGRLPIGKAQSWEILILIDQRDYKIAINGQHFCEFPHRIPFGDVTHLLIDGDVTITLISWEGIVGVGEGESASRVSEVNAEGPQAPTQGPPGNFIPQSGYGPAGGYNVPGGYGPPPGNYGYGVPPPPGAQPESGFDNFLEQAQGVLAGAIKSGAAEKLLGSFFSSGQPQQQGYAHQNAKYGIYPDLPQDLDLNLKQSQVKQQPGPVESLLTSLLSGGNKQQSSQQYPQNLSVPTQSQQSNQLDLTSLLSGLVNAKQQDSHEVASGVNQPNISREQQEQNVDWGALLGNLISGGKQQTNPGNAPVGPNPNQRSNTQQNSSDQQTQNVDFGGLLSSLIAGGNQQPQNQSQVPMNQSGGQNVSQSKGIDLNVLLGGLLSGAAAQNATRPIQETGKQQQTLHNPSSEQPVDQQGVDLGQILSGLLSNVSRSSQQTGGQNFGHEPSGGAYNQQGGMQQPGQVQTGSQQHGFDLGSLLSSLISPGSTNSQGPHGPTGPQTSFEGNKNQYGPIGPGKTSVPHQPSGNLTTGSQNTSISSQGNIRKPNERQTSQPASKDEVEDVSDQLAEAIAAESHASQQNSSKSQQYGQYPHAQSNQGQGPVENLLSSFLGGGQQTHQQPSQFGGGESVGGLGSMSGLLQNFAGQILQPKDTNQRQNY